VQLVSWLCVFWWVGGNDVLKQWGLWFTVEQGSGSGIDVGVGGEVDVFPLGGVNGVVDGEGKFEVVVENIIR